MAKVKCRYCKKTIEKENALSVPNGKRNKYYCDETCHEKDNEQANVSKETQDKEVSQWKQLMDYLTQLYGNKINYPFLCSQIKNMKTEYNMKDGGILLTLKYMYEIRELTFDDDKGLGLIPYYYNDAKNFYIRKFKIEEMVKNTQFNNEPIVITKIEKRH